jgi:hypothetical protein
MSFTGRISRAIAKSNFRFELRIARGAQTLAPGAQRLRRSFVRKLTPTRRMISGRRSRRPLVIRLWRFGRITARPVREGPFRPSPSPRIAREFDASIERPSRNFAVNPAGILVARRHPRDPTRIVVKLERTTAVTAAPRRRCARKRTLTPAHAIAKT